MRLVGLCILWLLNFMAMAQLHFIQGHRGFRGLYPENTIPAFEQALKAGVRVLEMDVCISADGQVLVSHEPYMNSIYSSKPDGQAVTKEEERKFNLFLMTYEDIKQFDTGKRGNASFPEQKAMVAHKPLLSEVLALGEAFRKKHKQDIFYNIEIKSVEAEYGISQPKTVEEFSEKVWTVISKQVKPEYIMLQSFDFQVLKYWNKAMKEGKFPAQIMLSALVSRKSPENTIKDLGFVPAIYSPNYQSLSPELVVYCHKNGMKVVPWTANEADAIARLAEMGVDAVITDYPNRVPQYLKPVH
ncbi:glycerophosphodiester phosphodiesterase family protein [Aquirufa ecclesiirivi]|uniref:glycerophosphodiester phosphodiesterase family protein n=1 Tax=Aquirufa ecclesiirivi TaxID=2715124 RepID=UPI0023D7BA9D|nr:glycerophosphodiester phosphodiesterase family protein [Aquirufa ecclesiirivi]MDF0692419.1 glycerophosphodiester phosphodiesterase family protein [Aquirufa ecclesiirivi]